MWTPAWDDGRSSVRVDAARTLAWHTRLHAVCLLLSTAGLERNVWSTGRAAARGVQGVPRQRRHCARRVGDVQDRGAARSAPGLLAWNWKNKSVGCVFHRWKSNLNLLKGENEYACEYLGVPGVGNIGTAEGRERVLLARARVCRLPEGPVNAYAAALCHTIRCSLPRPPWPASYSGRQLSLAPRPHTSAL